jgi:DNA-binding sugar fermentation-stimulating protein
MTQILKLNNIIEGIVVKRPSKHIKTPYVADVKSSITGEEVLCHTASLGCCGLADTNALILMTPNSNKKTTKCSHSAFLSIIQEKDKDNNAIKEVIIGINPKLAEQLVETALNKNLFSKLQNIKSYNREKAIYIKDKVDSRFDFTGTDQNGIPFIMEVKNVPLADYEDLTLKERKKYDFAGRAFDTKVAYFPDGYRKSSREPVSPRALKHIKELTYIKSQSTLEKPIRCIMCYVIQRDDVNRFQVSVIDLEYRKAVKDAIESGIEIITMIVSWNRQGEASFVRDDLPITSFD